MKFKYNIYTIYKNDNNNKQHSKKSKNPQCDN
jgi:hypothetical protein